jgi:hypothetical protein
LTPGVVADDAALVATGLKEDNWIVMAGGVPNQVTLEIVAVDGKNALKFGTVSNWGPGLDLVHPVIKFRAGDEILIQGTVQGNTGGSTGLIMDKHGGNPAPIGDAFLFPATIDNTPFELKATLTAADVTAIGKLNPPAIRIKGNVGDKCGGITFTISEIVITGVPRSFTPVESIDVPTRSPINEDIALPKLADPVTANNRTVTWTLGTDAGTLATGATLDADGYTLKTITTPGALKVTGTVVNGLTASTPFVKEYTIEITDAPTIWKTLDKTNYDSTNWEWIDSAFALANFDDKGMKGKIDRTVTAAMQALPTGSFVRIFWEVSAANGTFSANNGLASFAGKGFNSPADIIGVTDGTADIPISELSVGDADTDPTFFLNTYGNGAIVVKIEIWQTPAE